MSRWNFVGSTPRRWSRGDRPSNSLGLRRRFIEWLEPRRLFASDSYVEFNLASNQPGTALVTDPSLGYAWGIAASIGAGGGFSVSDTSNGRSNSYSGDLAGSPFVEKADQTVFVPLATGQVSNGNANEFIVHTVVPPGSEAPIAGGPAEFILASLDGTLYGFSANLGQQALPAATVNGAVFTGLTLANNGTADQLYAADFAGGKIDVFDANFQPVSTDGSFTDPNLPDGYKPFNIQSLGGELYVSYSAAPIVQPANNVSGPLPPIFASNGVVDAFDANGAFLGRIASGSPLNQPWGMALAPPSFGPFAGDLLVANHGDGEINVFDPTPGGNGKPLGTLDGADGNPFVVNGLLGLAFGNGAGAGNADSLYFTAGALPFLPPLADPMADVSSVVSSIAAPAITHGLFGTIQFATANPLAAVGTDLTANSGKELSGAVASFGSADPPSPLANPVASYTATIDWGDGTTSSGNIVPTGNGGYLVVASHTYAKAGDYDYRATIRDTGGNSATATGTVQVTAATLEAKATPVVSHGLSVDNATVASFFDTGGADPLANYSATIDWGDGTTSAGAITGGIASSAANAAGGLFAVSGSHIYASTGDYTLTVSISDSDGSQAAVKGVAHVVLPPLLATGVPVVVKNGLSVNGAIVAAFADAAGGDAMANYSATIDWGDGATSAGTVAEGGTSNSFIVTGSHDYTTAGHYVLKIAIADQDGSKANITAHAFIDFPVAFLITKAFQDVLHRTPDDSGLDYWNQQIAGGLPVGQFADDLAHSDEYYAKNVIAPAYQTYLGRAADEKGLAYWVSQMGQGITDQQIEANFIASPEFYARAGGSNSAWVNAMYQVVLGRQADVAGSNYWTSQLAAGAGRSTVAMGFAAGQEREAQLIQDDYFTYLGRSASPAEISYWVARFEHGATNEDIVSGFVGSSEYVKLHS